MWFIVLSLLVLVGGLVFIFTRDSRDVDIPEKFMFSLIFLLSAGLALSLIGYPAIASTTGLFDGYSSGTRDGYLTKSSVVGVIWKTTEAQIQVGTGQMAALQEPFEFSIKDSVVIAAAQEHLSQKVRVEYRQWLIQPFRYGGTSYECVSITPLDEE